MARGVRGLSNRLGCELESKLIGCDDRLGSVTCAERAQDCADMNLDGAFGKVELTADELIGQAPENQAQHVTLAAGEAEASRIT